MSPSTVAGPVVHAPNAALLIDFDNVTMGIRSDLQTELRNLLSSDIVHGKVAVQRAYADWRRYPQYIVPLSEASIDLIFAPAYGSSKKNATDIRLAIDAMELVFTRPEIGTIILLSGDSDFSSLVIKLKEYGKYVIGVGIRESSSDLLVQNCDEYYSYNALAGLVKTGETEGTTKYDPWELVTESIHRMQRNGDVMRSDRLKQVMQEIDNSFDEKNLGISKFSKFCLEAAQKGLLQVTKLENGQLDVAPPRAANGAPAAAAAPAPVRRDIESHPAGEGEAAPTEGRTRRGRRGGRGRKRGERSAAPVMSVTAEHPVVEPFVPSASAASSPLSASAASPDGADARVGRSHAAGPDVARVPAAAAPPVARPLASADAALVTRTTPTAHATPVTRGSSHHAPPESRAIPGADGAIGVSGIRLTRDEAFSLVRDAVAALASVDEAVPSERVRQKAFALLGRDSESLSERNFARILRDAHDGDVVDLRKRGDAFEVAAAATAPSVADQLQVKEAALKATADRAKASNTPPVPRGMGPRGAPARGGRGLAKAAPPASLFLVGVVDDAPAAEEPKPRRARKSRAKKAPADE